jgi:uncharacterized protein
MSEISFLNLVPYISKELSLPLKSVQIVISLLNEGNTIPFISRYRKEATGNLNEVEIASIQERYQYLVELEERKNVIIDSISTQGKLTQELEKQIRATMTKPELEDLYLPYKPKRRTRAMIARERGLEPLAQWILQQPLQGNVTEEAGKYINIEKELPELKQVLQGARDIIAEMVSENAEIRGHIRGVFFNEGILASKVIEEKLQEAAKYQQYYDFSEAIATIPSHRYLAIRRGEEEGMLQVTCNLESAPLLHYIAQQMQANPKSVAHEQLQLAITDSYKRFLAPTIETDIRVALKQRSDEGAVEIFAQNLRNLLLTSPLGEQMVLGVDPGIRTGCKCALVDSTGKYLVSFTIFLSQGASALQEAKNLLRNILGKYPIFAIAVGNGTAGRETELFLRNFLKEENLKHPIVVPVNESGASVYSASEVARDEFPELDLTIRGAISIARRLQDPLAELVKIDPKSIGVGQYQHDVYQQLLSNQLLRVVESCVNHVGVELNTASAPLLARVSGIGETLAKRIVEFRNQNGPFKTREELKRVRGLGEKIFQQSAGFLRIRAGDEPLDGSAVHPERYALVQQMAKDLQVAVDSLIGKSSLLKTIDYRRYCTPEAGEITIKDILAELEKPGRDPRSHFEPPQFRDDVMSIEDLKEGMVLEGIVTNVTAFGAFVDIGVHCDGLVHVSQLSDRFVRDPSEVVKAGDRIRVTVLEVEVPRKRISLSGKQGAEKVLKGIATDTKDQKGRPAASGVKKSNFSSGKEEKKFASSPFDCL